MRKWPDRGHYRFHATKLGEDEHGTWIAFPAGSLMAGGPNGDHYADHGFVAVVPRDRWYIATFFEPPKKPDFGLEIYVDITTPATWISETHIMTVDLDLDVVRNRDGTLFIDDEDEFEEHRIAYSYPDDVVANATATASAMFDAIRAGAEPFGSAYKPWLNRLLGESIDVP
jgi:hypothetical protein